MADTATRPDDGAPGDRPTGDQSDPRREPGRNESMADRARSSGMSQMVRSGDPIALAAFGSVLFSWYQFYVRKNRQYGLFVGLWAPTLLAMASYVQRRTDEN